MPIDYTKQWPLLAPQWCQEEIDKCDLELSQGPTYLQRLQLERRKAVLRRIKADYETKALIAPSAHHIRFRT